MPTPLEQLESILSFGTKEFITRKELLAAFKAFMKHIQSIRREHSNDFQLLSAALKEAEKRIGGDSQIFRGETLKELREIISTTIADVEAKIPTMPELLPLETRIAELEKRPTIDLDKELPKYGERVRDALELLTGDERLEIKAVKDLQETIDELRKLKRDTILVGGGSASGGKIMKVHDLSSSLDGVTKTFNLPAFWRVISVHSSSFPNAFRPTTDYTTDGSAMTITFTSAVDGATTLASGQTLIVTYAEA